MKASFSLIGENVEARNNKEILKKIYEEGHLIGKHPYYHVDISKLENKDIYREIEEINSILKGINGEKRQFIRPPFGQWRTELESGLSMISVFEASIR